MAWEFKREANTGFTTAIPEGKHRIRIKSADKAVSKSGNDMLVLQFDVSGYNVTLYHYITFMTDKPEITNRMLTQFFDSFKDIEEGDFDTNHWIGKVGACTVKHEEYNGNVNAKVGYFIKADKQDELPPWKEGNGGNDGGAATDNNGFLSVPDGLIEELPF
jgi:hypothetical protein